MGFDQLQANGNPSISGFYSTQAQQGLASQQALQAQQIQAQQQLAQQAQANDMLRYQYLMQAQQQEQAAKAQLAQQQYLQQIAQQQYLSQQLAAAGINPNLANAVGAAGADSQANVGNLVDYILKNQDRQAAIKFVQEAEANDKKAFEDDPTNKGKTYQPSPILTTLGTSLGSGASLSDLTTLYTELAKLPIEQQKAYAAQITAQAQAYDAETKRQLVPSQSAKNYGSAAQSNAQAGSLKAETGLKQGQLDAANSFGVAGVNPVDAIMRGNLYYKPTIPNKETLQYIPTVEGSVYSNDVKTANATAQNQAFTDAANNVTNATKGVTSFIVGTPTTNAINQGIQNFGAGLDQLLKNQQQNGVIPNFINYIFGPRPNTAPATSPSFVGK